MPAESEPQRQAAGAALAVKRGQAPRSKLRGASRSMFNSMTVAQLADFASKPRTTREVIGEYHSEGNPHPKRKSKRHKK
ncbi:hypothetical protein LCGC14_1722080 [marine sediment metagenome]|uniref:DUF3008 domain-containing protein n=1 Tax=marine sediment metagenome TaxID=412755 RepID=A0A0F9HBX1_9ZZZZ